MQVAGAISMVECYIGILILVIIIEIFDTLNFRQNSGSLQLRSSTSVSKSRFSFHTTAVTDDVKTTLSIVSVWAQASNTLSAALTSISAVNSWKNYIFYTLELIASIVFQGINDICLVLSLSNKLFFIDIKNLRWHTDWE